MLNKIHPTTGRRRFLPGFVRSALLAAAMLVCHPANAAQKQFTYRVETVAHGDVGTYVFVFDTTGDTTLITVTAHLKVTALGIVLYTREVSGHERWVKDRLEEFHSVTTTNDEPATIDGRIEGDHFAIITPSGTTSAPLTIRPISPWTAGTPGDATMFVAGTGAVKQVHIDNPQDTTIKIGDTDTPVSRYAGETADGKDHFQVFLDHGGTPVMFTNKDPENDATLTLIP